MAQPMRRGVRVAAGALHDRLQDVIDAPLGDREHPIRRRSVTALARNAFATSAGSSTCRGLSPLPTSANWTSPVSRGRTCDQVSDAISRDA